MHNFDKTDKLGFMGLDIRGNLDDLPLYLDDQKLEEEIKRMLEPVWEVVRALDQYLTENPLRI